MTRNPALASLLLLLAARPTLACEAQVPNEVYLSARAEVARMRASGEPSAERKQNLEAEWAGLEAEQKLLWDRAGKIDEACRQGKASDDLVDYNVQVLDWQERLRRFLRKLSTPDPAPSSQILPSLSPDAGSGTTGTSEVSFPTRNAPVNAPTPSTKEKREAPASPQPRKGAEEPLAPRELLN